MVAFGPFARLDIKTFDGVSDDVSTAIGLRCLPGDSASRLNDVNNNWRHHLVRDIKAVLGNGWLGDKGLRDSVLVLSSDSEKISLSRNKSRDLDLGTSSFRTDH